MHPLRGRSHRSALVASPPSGGRLTHCSGIGPGAISGAPKHLVREFRPPCLQVGLDFLLRQK
eukprot:8165384-Alexandrium_andersonii.AAC.1